MIQHTRLAVASVALGVSLILAPASHAQTRYTAVDLGGPPGSNANHAGLINDRGEGAGITGTPSIATVWTRDGIVALGSLGPPQTDSLARGINKRGDVVGDSAFISGWPYTRHGFLWRDGVLTDLGTLAGKTDSYAAAINDHGDIAGTSYTPGRGTQIVLWRNGTITDLGQAGGSDAVVTGMNNRRQIIGYAVFGSFSRPFIWQDGVFTYLPALSDATYPWAINDRGEIAGSASFDDGTQRAVLWRDGAIIDLGRLPGSRYTSALGINDHGQVVGFALNPDIRTYRAFVWEDGRTTELPPLPGSPWAVAAAINNHGEIVGFGPNARDDGHLAIMWIPTKGR